jgi:hypothetical protein
MWRRTALCAALIGTCGLRVSAEPGDDRREFLTQCTLLQEEIYAQRRLHNELFADVLAHGVEKGAWSEADRVIAMEAHADVLAPVPGEMTSSDDLARRSKAKRTPQRGTRLPIAALRATTSVESWFLLHRYYLDGLFDSVTHAQAHAAVEYAENIWLNAQKGADLAPAVRPLLDARERGVRWPMDAHQRRAEQSSARMPGAALRVAAIETFDAWTIVASPDGLLPPNVEAATAAEFARWRETWEAVRTIGNTFVVRRAIAARLAEIMAQRREMEARSTDNVNRLIMSDAPIAALEEALKAMTHLVGGMQLPERAQGSLGPPPMGRLRDYRDLLRDLSSSRPPFMRELPGVSSEWFGACNTYIGWRKGGGSDRAAAEKARSTLKQSLRVFPLPVAARIRQRLDESAKASAGFEEFVPEIIPGQEAETLAGALEKFAGSDRGTRRGTAEFSALARAVRDDLAGEQATRGNRERTDGLWLALAELPEARRLIPLRDSAVRAGLQKLGITDTAKANDPVLRVWREAIEKEAEAGRLEKVAELLDLDRRYSIAPAEESVEWSQFLSAVQSTAQAQRSANLGQQILRTKNPSVMRAIALKLKRAGGG